MYLIKKALFLIFNYELSEMCIHHNFDVIMSMIMITNNSHHK
jgi:hypothetical protein